MNVYVSENESDAETEPETDYDTETDSSETDYCEINISMNIENKYTLLIPELYNKYIHGKTNESDPNINGQFMVLQTFNYNNSNENKVVELFNYIDSISKFYKKYYLRNFRGLKHELIKNYKNIIINKSFLNVEIGQVYYLKGDECVCIIKTFWLKLVQRAWKKIYKQRMLIQKKRRMPNSLLYRQITAKWPDNCNYMPSIRGMLL
jgi:hypothetical protein